MLTIKKGDNVIILAGKDKGKQGKVMRVFPKDGKAIVEGLNQVKKRRKPRKSGEKGQTLAISMPLPLSRLALYCGACRRGVRMGMEIRGEKKFRVCKKCGKEL